MASDKAHIPSFCTPSVIGENLFVPNPIFNKVSGLHKHDLMALYDAIDVNSDDVDYLLDQYGDLLDSIIDDFEREPEVPPTMPPAPQAQNIYSRTSSEVVVHDLGSGDGKKASKCQSRIKMFDKDPKAAHVIERDVDEMDFVSGVIYTSYNALTQLRPETVEQLMDKEGLHLIPDMNYLRTSMASEEVNGKLVTRGEKNVYEDYDHGLEGDEVCTGYVIINAYEKKEINIKFGDTPTFYKGKTFNVPIKEASQQLPVSSTPKYDGVAVRLRSDGKRCSISLRNGRTARTAFRGPVFDLLLEKLPVNGEAEAYVLLRVVYYLGRVPYHGYAGLKRFCSRVKIKIDGVPVLPPGHHSLRDMATDGLIFRLEGHDYRLKDRLTFDATHRTLKSIIKDNGLHAEVKHLGQPANVRLLMEFAVERQSNGSYIFHYIKDRSDKDEGTPIDTILKYIEMAPVVMSENEVVY